MKRMRLTYSSRRGTSLIEFAIVAMILFTTVFGVFEFCRMGLVYTNLASASRVAVRYAITHGVDRSLECGAGGSCGSGDSTAAASNICGTSGVLTTFAIGPLDRTHLQCSTSGLGGAPGTIVKVTVTYAYDPWYNITPYKVTLSSTSQGVITY